MQSFRGIFCLMLCLGVCSLHSRGLAVELDILNNSSEEVIKLGIHNITFFKETAVNEGMIKVVDKLVSILKNQDDKIKKLEEFNKKLLGKIDQVEQQTKVNNLIFTNVQESKNENQRLSVKKVLHILNNVMKVRTKAEDISVALRVDSNNATEVRPIVVRFTNYADKMRVLAAKNKLKNSKVEISVDYSELVNQRRKELLPFLLEKRALGHDAFILYDKLMVDGVRVSLEDLKAERKNEEEKEEKEAEQPTVDLTLVEDPTTETAETYEQYEEQEVDVFPLFQDQYYEVY